MNSGLPASEPGLSGALGLVSSLSPATLAMDQPAGLQVDYVFRGVEHAVRVVVSGIEFVKLWPASSPSLRESRAHTQAVPFRAAHVLCVT